MSANNKQDEKRVGALLLAGGTSSRLGSPKQLLIFEGQTLVKRMLDVALNSNTDPVVVVLGAHAELVQKEIDNSSAHNVVNTDWEEGLASSIRAGINTLLAVNPEITAAVLIFCDQPFVSTDIVNTLIDAYKKTGKPIVTCAYADTFGPPTLFHRSMFGELLQLKGDTGARNILRDHANNVEAVFFPEGTLDIDTKSDYDKLSKGNLAL